MVRLSPASASHSKVLSIAVLKAPSWAPSKLVAGDRGDHHARPSRAPSPSCVGGRRAAGGGRAGRPRPRSSRAGRTSRSRPRRPRPARTTPRPRTGPSSPACRRCRRGRRRPPRAGRGRPRPRRWRRRRPPARRRRAGRSRPASGRAAPGSAGARGAGRRSRVKPPPTARPTARQGLKGRKTSPRMTLKKREAEPGGDEEEGEGEVAVGRFGAAQAGVDRDAEQEDPDRAAEDLRRQAEQRRARAPPRGAASAPPRSGACARRPRARRRRRSGRSTPPRRTARPGSAGPCAATSAWANGRKKLTG